MNTIGFRTGPIAPDSSAKLAGLSGRSYRGKKCYRVPDSFYPSLLLGGEQIATGLYFNGFVDCSRHHDSLRCFKGVTSRGPIGGVRCRSAGVGQERTLLKRRLFCFESIGCLRKCCGVVFAFLGERMGLRSCYRLKTSIALDIVFAPTPLTLDKESLSSPPD